MRRLKQENSRTTIRSRDIGAEEVGTSNLAAASVTEAKLAAPLGVWVELGTLSPDGTTQCVSFIDGTDGVVIDTTYELYMIEFEGIYVNSTGANIYWQLGNSGGFVSSGYLHNGSNSATTTSVVLTQATGTSAATNTVNGQIIIRNPCAAKRTHFQFTVGHNIGTTHYTEQSTGHNTSTTAVDRFRLCTDNGAIEIDGGIIRLFGMHT